MNALANPVHLAHSAAALRARSGGLQDLGRAAALLARFGIFFLQHRLDRLLRRRHPQAGFGPRLRRLLETSGVTAIKIGQYLAIRIDLLPPEVTRELARLFDAVPALPFARIREVIEQEFGVPLSARFRYFETRPIGAASIAQVHRARDRDGHWLAVKVQRPGVADTLRADFRILRSLARLADRLALFGSISAVALIDEIAAFTLREIDFEQEGRTADRIRRDAIAGVHIPRIYWDLTTPRVLAMELIRGTPLADIVNGGEGGDRRAFARVAPGAEPREIVETLSKACLRQLFVTGVFQGDPHPANILIERDGTVAFVDFGIFGELTPEDRRILRRYVRNLALGRFEAAFADYAELVEPTAATDMTAYRRDTLRIMAEWHRSAGDPDLPPQERLTARFQGRMFQVMREHQVRMRRDLVLFWRALAVLDSTAQRLPVRFDLLATIRRFFAEQSDDRAAAIRHLAGSFRPAALETAVALRRHAVALARRPLDGRWRAEFTLVPALRRAEGAAAKTIALALAAIAVAATAGAAGPDGAAGLILLMAAASLAAAVHRAVSWRRI